MLNKVLNFVLLVVMISNFTICPLSIEDESDSDAAEQNITKPSPNNGIWAILPSHEKNNMTNTNQESRPNLSIAYTIISVTRNVLYQGHSGSDISIMLKQPHMQIFLLDNILLI